MAFMTFFLFSFFFTLHDFFQKEKFLEPFSGVSSKAKTKIERKAV